MPRNKTIDLSLDEGQAELSRCLRLDAPAAAAAVTDRTILGDCFRVLPLLPEGLADLVIADPPYNLRRDFGEQRFPVRSEADYRDWCLDWLRPLRRCMKPGASLYVCCDWRSSGAVAAALGELFTVRNRITWQREKGRGAARNWKNSMEDVWFATLGDDYYFDLEAVKLRRRVIAPYRSGGVPKDWERDGDGTPWRLTCPGNFWDDLTVPFWSMPENTAHPTQKPEKLLARLILASCPPEGLVLDPFLGSGSSSVAAKKLGRHYVGVEQNPQYCVWAERRLALADTDKRIQGYEDGVFWERNSGK